MALANKKYIAVNLIVTNKVYQKGVPYRGAWAVFMKYTQTTLDKIEKIISETGYVVRYERGTFQSGFCILEDRKVVVLNKFLQLEGRINTLIDLAAKLTLDADILTPESRKVFTDIMERHPLSNNPEKQFAACSLSCRFYLVIT